VRVLKRGFVVVGTTMARICMGQLERTDMLIIDRCVFEWPGFWTLNFEVFILMERLSPARMDWREE